MVFLSTLLQLYLLAVVHATSIGQGIHRSRSQEIEWRPCELKGATTPVSCGNLSVPLDYTNKQSNATLTLELFRIPATSNPSHRSILFNFGGPGDSGVRDFATFGALLQVLTGGHHDLVTFVPRGTGNAILFSCYNNPAERSIAQLGIIAGNASDVALGQLWGNTQILADTCYGAQNKTGSLIGTAFVARDMMRIVDALGDGDGMLRYWGFSYGTILGATAAAMFPERMDKIILDGVVNPHEYYQNKEVELLTDTDKVFAGFCSGCVADPSRCALARNHTAASVQEALYSFISNLKYHPIVVPTPAGEFLLDYSLIKQLTFIILYSPVAWPRYAGFLDGLLTRNMTPVVEYITDLLSVPPVVEAEAMPGIKCSDVVAPPPPRASASSSAMEQILPVIEGRHRRSRIAGDAADDVPMACAQWRMAARERYRGDFRVRTRRPVLLIGNSADPVTPLASARNVSEGFGGSVLLQHGGYGHSSVAQASLCTAKVIRAYFGNGTLPAPGTVCDVHVPLFAGTDGWGEVVADLVAGGNATVTREASRTSGSRPGVSWDRNCQSVLSWASEPFTHVGVG